MAMLNWLLMRWELLAPMSLQPAKTWSHKVLANAISPNVAGTERGVTSSWPWLVWLWCQCAKERAVALG